MEIHLAPAAPEPLAKERSLAFSCHLDSLLRCLDHLGRTHECATACGPRWVAGHESTVAQIEFGLPAMFRPPIRALALLRMVTSRGRNTVSDSTASSWNDTRDFRQMSRSALCCDTAVSRLLIIRHHDGLFPTSRSIPSRYTLALPTRQPNRGVV
ncbi:hypothetical protein GHK34_25265 [Sinorhizobium meliloti]|nr:hypothetical protein [Sinorhizobium meliloti]MQU84431.1 hypothetical protein [Sinorhizobium meliloti]MQU84471.1 hypothetical protein [Sinorhizobium meliloti]MQU87787.1 hypothetical protein [Sinorhizobium meliloti]MQU88786.1 hypothetical protein [Sinorhizobium meliloti]